MVNAVDRTLLEESIAPTSSGSGLVRVVLDGGRDECDHYQGSRKGGQRTATRCTFRGASNERGAPEPRASYGCGVLANGGRDERSQLMDHWVVATYGIPEEDENARRAFA